MGSDRSLHKSYCYQRLVGTLGTALLVACGANQSASQLPATAAQPQAQSSEHSGKLRYSLKILGTLGGNFGFAQGVNASGEVAGISATPGSSTLHAFLWRHGKMIDLGALGGIASETQFNPINDRSDIAGFLDTGVPDPYGENFCSLPTNDSCLPFVWRQGVMTLLPLFGGNNAYAGTPNDRGQITGLGEKNGKDYTCPPPQVLDFVAIVWGPRPKEMHILPPLSGDTEAGAFGISQNGIVGGASGSCTAGPAHAVLWQNGEPTELPNLGGATFHLVFSVNNRAHAVGQSDLPGDASFHAVLWRDGKIIDLGTIDGLPNSLASSINASDQIAGDSQDAYGNVLAASLWQNGRLYDLNTLVPSSTYTLVEANGINDRGQLAGTAIDFSSGLVRPYLATPCDKESLDKKACEVRRGASMAAVLPEKARRAIVRWNASWHHLYWPTQASPYNSRHGRAFNE